MFLIHITTLENKTIYSNIPSVFDFQNPTTNVETVFCTHRHINRRQILIKNPVCNIFFACYDSNVTNKIFKHYVRAIEQLSPALLKASEEMQKVDIQKSKRLKHNLVNHTTKIHQQLYRLVSQDDIVKSRHEQLAKIEDSIKKKPKDAAYVFLRVLKSINFMKAEFDVYDMLHASAPFMDFNKHPIHKVLMLALTPFWLDFLEKNIQVNIEPCNDSISIDYKSFSVALSHIFDNAIKYSAPNTELNISFNRVGSWFIIYFTMTSLEVEADEVKELFNENYSGRWAKELELSGTGIGMFVLDKLIKLNHGSVEFKTNIDSAKSFKKSNIPYCVNQLIITLNTN